VERTDADHLAACQLSAGTARVDPMPRIAGQVVILTVSDADRSATWYCDLLGMDETSRYVQPDGHVALIHLVERLSGVERCLVDHRSDRPSSTNSGLAGSPGVPGGSPR